MATQLVQPNPLHYISIDDALKQINAIREALKPSGAKLMSDGALKAMLGGKVGRGHILRTDLAVLLAKEQTARVSRTGTVTLPVTKKDKKKPYKK